MAPLPRTFRQLTERQRLLLGMHYDSAKSIGERLHDAWSLAAAGEEMTASDYEQLSAKVLELVRADLEPKMSGTEWAWLRDYTNHARKLESKRVANGRTRLPYQGYSGNIERIWTFDMENPQRISRSGSANDEDE